MELESLVRDVLREHAADAPTADGLLAAVTARRARRTRWIVGGLSTAAVVVLAVSLAAVRGPDPVARSSTPPSRPAGPTRPAGPALSTPPGYTRVAYHEFTVAVPHGLPVITTPCLAPPRYVFAEDPDVAYSCAWSGVHLARQTLTVRLTSADSVPDEIGTVATEIGALPARIGYGRLTGYPGIAGEAVFADQNIGIVVTAPDRSTVEQILTSVRSGPDPNGCPAGFRAPADPALDALVPGTPTSAVRCVYASTQTDVLQASLPVRPSALGALVHAIDTLPTTPRDNPQPPVETDLLRFDYSDGSSRTLSILLSDPTSYSDGSRTGYDASNVVTDQLRSATS